MKIFQKRLFFVFFPLITILGGCASQTKAILPGGSMCLIDVDENAVRSMGSLRYWTPNNLQARAGNIVLTYEEAKTFRALQAGLERNGGYGLTLGPRVGPFAISDDKGLTRDLLAKCEASRFVSAQQAIKMLKLLRNKLSACDLELQLGTARELSGCSIPAQLLTFLVGTENSLETILPCWRVRIPDSLFR